MVEEHLQVLPGNEARVTHIDIHISPAAVSADSDMLLTHQVLEVAALEASDGSACHLGGPLHLGGASWGRLKRQEGPGIALGGPRVLGHHFQVRGYTSRHRTVFTHSENVGGKTLMNTSPRIR